MAAAAPGDEIARRAVRQGEVFLESCPARTRIPWLRTWHAGASVLFVLCALLALQPGRRGFGLVLLVLLGLQLRISSRMASYLLVATDAALLVLHLNDLSTAVRDRVALPHGSYPFAAGGSGGRLFLALTLPERGTLDLELLPDGPPLRRDAARCRRLVACLAEKAGEDPSAGAPTPRASRRR